MTVTQTVKPSSKDNLWYKNSILMIFVIGLPLLVVIACIGLVIYAVYIQDTVVRDDWYMDGKTLYADVSKDKLAYDLALSAKMSIDQTGQVKIYLTDGGNEKFDYPKQLMVAISHATQIEKDRDFIANLVDEQQNLYVGQVDLVANKSKYYIMLHNPENSWRLQTKLNLPNHETILLQPLSVFADTSDSVEIHETP